MSRLCDVEAKIIGETDKAYCIRNDKTPEEGVWVPKSTVEVDEGEKGWAIFTMPEWFAAEKELV